MSLLPRWRVGLTVQTTLLYALLLATVGSGLQYVAKAAKMLA